MNLQRLAVLIRKEFSQNSGSMMFIFALVVPIVFSLIVSLLFGTLFSGKPKIGVVDQGDSALTHFLQEADYLVIRIYDNKEALVSATEAGAVDVGIVLPAGIDELLKASATSHIDIFVWGQSLLKHQGIITSAIGNGLITVAGTATPVDIVTEELGTGVNVAWEKRLLPFIVLITIVIGGGG